ncbi:MAG: AbrB/MazE/SpoVT family DNA-binding domain-containing protein [Deltaproteobacteria bacterium]|nr:AbrB/MazE/SpoVT family DNA-binding domain-containing protein [Deltaproteobacteria bacterium]
MAQAVVSTKYQVVIPLEIRRALGLTVGQRVQVLAKSGVITLVPIRPLAKVRGLVKGMSTKGFRDKKDRA